MKTKELIKQLKGYPPESEVCVAIFGRTTSVISGEDILSSIAMNGDGPQISVKTAQRPWETIFNTSWDKAIKRKRKLLGTMLVIMMLMASPCFAYDDIMAQARQAEYIRQQQFEARRQEQWRQFDQDQALRQAQQAQEEAIRRALQDQRRELLSR